MYAKVQQTWEDFLNPDVVRPVLISASIYIAGFEALKETIIGRIHVRGQIFIYDIGSS